VGFVARNLVEWFEGCAQEDAEMQMRVPRLTIDMLVAVVALAQRRTMESAAEELGLMTPSGVQKRIHAASKLIGAPLFMNTEKGMMLTKTGEHLYPDALRALEMVLLAEDKTTALLDLEAGRLRVGHSTYLPPRLLAMVHRISFNDSDGIHIEHLPGLTATTVQRVVEGTAHAGFGYLPINHPDLLSHVLYEEPVVVCMSTTHSLAAKPSIRPQDLDGVPVIAVAREALPWMHQDVEEFFAGFGIALRIVADAFAPPEAVIMAEQKIGICLVGASAVSRPGVVGKPLSPRTLSQKCGLFVREDNRHPTLKAFVDLVLNESRNLH
jgi:DNA-binding transcriptional LysR family regulator